MNVHTLASLIAIASVIATSPASAAPRTFVASSGIDTNPCSLPQPCRSFATAIAKTSSGGEIIVLDSAGYGPATISQPVTISAPAGVYAGITVPAGADGITVSSGVTVLRGLTLGGEGAVNGIRVQAATVIIDGCTIDGSFLNGVLVDSSSALVIRNSRFNNNQTAVRIAEGTSVDIDGIAVYNATDIFGAVNIMATHDAIVTKVSVTNSIFMESAAAIRAQNDGNGLVHLAAARNTIVGTSFGIAGTTGAGPLVINAAENFISTLGVGIQVLGPGLTLIASANQIAAGYRGIDNPNLDSTMITLQNNTIEGNGIDVNGTLVPRSLK